MRKVAQYFFSLFFLAVLIPSFVTAAVLTDPAAAGHPQTYFYDNSQLHNNTVIQDNSVIQEGGVIKETEAPTIKKRTVREPLILNLPGIGDTCTIGVPDVHAWQIARENTVSNKEELKKIAETALVNDTRLRRISIADNRIDFYYLMPAYRLRFIPVNYQLHIIADANTLRMSLENPKWVATVPNKHAVVSQVFSEQVPNVLNEELVTSLKDASLSLRDAKMIEVIAGIMQKVDVMPHTGTLFSCYILPFFGYIIGAVILAILLIWYMVRRIRKLHRKNKFLGIGSIGGDDDDEDDEHGGFSPKVHYVPGLPDQ